MSNPIVLLLISLCASLCAAEIVEHWVQASGHLCHKNRVGNSDFHDDCNAHCMSDDLGYQHGECRIPPQLEGQPNAPHQCVCTTDKDCHARCYGDPHCFSFDGKFWPVWPVGEFVMLRNKPWNNKREELPPFKLYSSMRGGRSYVFAYRLEIYGQEFRVDTFLRKVHHNGRDITSELPYTWSVAGKHNHYNFLQVYKLPNGFYRIDTDIGLRVAQYHYYLYVYVPKTKDFLGKIYGFMGEFNADGNKTNDLVWPDGRLSAGDSPQGWTYDQVYAWSANADFEIKKTGAPEKVKNQCGGRAGKFKREFCTKNLSPSSKQSPFRQCFAANPSIANRAAEEFEGCAIDSCELIEDSHSDQEILEEPIVDVCASMEEVDKLCEAAGHSVPEWRRPGFCGVECKNGAVFQKCNRGPVKTCAGANKKEFKTIGNPDCASGCTCPPGKFLNEETNACVKKRDCPGQGGRGGGRGRG